MQDWLSFGINFLRHPDQGLQTLLDAYGLWIYLILFAIVFCETGLVVTPFLPGDSLLFAIGALVAQGTTMSLWGIFSMLVVAAILGDAVNYSIGYRLGPKVFRYDDSWLLNKKHLLRAQEFYERYGGRSIFLARFVPIVRTFAPFVAGIGKMRYTRFAAYNVVGAIAWVGICLFAGYFLGGLELIKKNFEIVLVLIVLISVVPIVLELMMERRRLKLLGAAQSSQKAIP